MVIKVAVIVFPGTNCYIETKKAIELAGLQAVFIWGENPQTKIKNKFQAVVIPGGFSYGDYLIAGKMAALSPVFDELKELSEKDFPILGICNGFQILCESGILTGTFLMNKGTKFICKWLEIKVEDINTPFTCAMEKGEVLKMMIAHKYGNFYSEKKPNIVFTYSVNPNGSIYDIAGISSPRGNVVGLMPHPERSIYCGNTAGLKFFLSLKKWLTYS